MPDRPDPNAPQPPSDGWLPGPEQAPDDQQGWSITQPGWSQQSYDQLGYGETQSDPQQRSPQPGHPQPGYPQPGYPLPPGPPQPGHQPGYPQPPAARTSKVGWLVGGGVILIVALAGVLGTVLAVTGGDDAPDVPPAAGAQTAGAHSPETVAAITACSSPPKISGQSASQTSAGLSVTATLTAACPGGDIVSNNDFQVAVTAGGKDVAAGSFNLVSTPIVIRGDESVQVSFVFPAGAYWRPADMTSGQLSMTGTLAGSSASPSPAAVQNPRTVTAASPGTPANGDANSAALATLGELKVADASTLRGLRGQWLPQISSKKIGLVAEGITWDNEAILQEFLANRARHPEALLLWSGDWATFDSPESYWVTVVGSPKSSYQAALSWCVSNNLDREHCLAKIVNATGSSEGTTKHQKD